MSGFPQPHPVSTVSHWQATNRGEGSLWLHGAKDQLPGVADIVIVGGGLSGAFLSYYLTRSGSAGEGKRIVVIEAKDIASGASGRNGGQLAPLISYSYPDFLRAAPDGPGLEQREALIALESEYLNYQATINLIIQNGIEKEVDLHIGQIVRPIFAQAHVDKYKFAHQQWVDARLAEGFDTEEENVYLVEDAVKAKEITRCEGTVAALVARSGSVQPHKLTTEVFKLALKSTSSNLVLFTHTHLISFSDSNGLYSLQTSKGEITTPILVMATNAHTPTLFPPTSSISKFIYPCRANAGLVVPPPSYSGDQRLKTSFVFAGGPYFCNTKSGLGLVMGSGWQSAVNMTGLTKEDFVDQTDDSFVLEPIKKWYGGFFKHIFPGWEEAPGEGLVKTWSGIMGYTLDTLPLVGSVPGQTNLFCSVGHHGHGMSRINICARGVAHQIATGQWDERLPSSFAISDKRFERVDGLRGRSAKYFTDQ